MKTKERGGRLECQGNQNNTRPLGLGWNPASNSEGREDFVVREVQGRRGPSLNVVQIPLILSQ